MPGFLAEVLHQPRNRNYRLAVKTARDWKLPPRAFVFGDHETGWTEADTLLAMALTVLETETCKNCGTPAWWGHSTDNTVQFRTKSAHCYGCEELEKEREKKSKDKSAKGHGDTTYVEPYHFFEENGARLPSRREAFEAGKKG